MQLICTNGLEGEIKVRTRFFFGQNKKRSLITNSLTKLWWCVRLTYDEQRKDPFELTKYLIDDYATKILIIFSNNYISNHDITVGLFSALKYLENIGYKIKGKNNGKSKELHTASPEYSAVFPDQRIFQDGIRAV